MAVCDSCGESNPQGARYCSACGNRLAAEVPGRGEARKTVTTVFADVAESTQLGERVDPESLRRVMSRYFETASRAVERHGGTVEKFIGDAVMAVFGIPEVHEDDALRAVRAAAEIRDAIENLNRELEHERGVRLGLRIGVNTGEVVAGDPSAGQSFVTGDAVNVAARLEQAAQVGEILIGDTTRRLVRDAVTVEPLGPLAVKGKTDGVRAWRLVDVAELAPPFRRRFESPLVGRAGELAQMRQAFERAVEERTTYLFTLLGAAGVGKSRLALELTSTVSDTATVLAGRCLPYGDGITFWPLFEMTRDLVGDSDDPREAIAHLVAAEEAGELIADRIAAALGRSGAPAAAEETFWAVRKLFEVLARKRPLVVVFEDIHWAEATLLEMIDHVADRSHDAPILVLCLARPELLEKKPDWGGGKLNATQILLEPLSEQEANALVDHLIGEGELPAAARLRIAEASEGNPLFLEQMLALMTENESVDPSGELEIPLTIQALLAARLDRLGAEERRVMERASVVGTRFWERAVADLSPESGGSDVRRNLQLLVRKELIRPERSVVGGDGYRFRHQLIRDAAYAAIPKAVRASLHERFARWIEDNAGERLTEFEEILGYHLEQAFMYRQELGPVDERGLELAARAGERLAAAGRRALTRGDAAAAVNLLTRAESLLPAGAVGRAELVAELGSALVLAGELSRADAVLTEAHEAAGIAENRPLQLHALLERAFVRALTDPDENVGELERIAERAIHELEQAGDERRLAEAWRRMADAHWMMSRWNQHEQALGHALAHAQRAGNAREAAGALMRLPLGLYYGPTPVPEAIRRAEEVLERADRARAAQSTALVCLAGLHAMAGRFDEARSLLADGRALCEELGFRVWLAGFSLVAGDIEMLAGDPRAAEDALRRGYRALEGMGERGLLATVAAELSRALDAQGKADSAERLTEVSEQMAGAGDVMSQIAWRTVRARVLARHRKFEAAESLAREALAIARRTDALNIHGRALVDLAETLETAGRPGEALPLVDEAVRVFEQKGNVAAARKTRELGVEVERRLPSGVAS